MQAADTFKVVTLDSAMLEAASDGPTELAGRSSLGRQEFLPDDEAMRAMLQETTVGH